MKTNVGKLERRIVKRKRKKFEKEKKKSICKKIIEKNYRERGQNER